MDLNERIEGWWYLPGDEHHSVFGVLSTIDDDMCLEIVQAAEPVDSTVLRRPFRIEPELQLIRGEDRKGNAITLLDCRQSSYERWHVDAAVLGRHLDTVNDQVSAVTIQFGSLLEWADDPVGVVSGLPRREAITLTSTETTVGSANVPGANLELVIGHDFSAGYVEASVTRRAFVRIQPTGDDIAIRTVVEEYGLLIRDLLAWVTRSYASIDSVQFRLRSDPSNEIRDQATCLARLTQPGRIPKPVESFHMIFSRTKFGLPFEDLMSAWATLWAEHRKTIRLITVPTSAPYLYTDSLILTAWLALEGYHAKAIQLTTEEAERYEREHNDRVDAIVASAPEEHREWAESQLREKNRIGQTLKLKQVIARAGATGQAILATNPNYVRNAVKGRHLVAHHSRSTTKLAPDSFNSPTLFDGSSRTACSSTSAYPKTRLPSASQTRTSFSTTSKASPNTIRHRDPADHEILSRRILVRR